MFLTFFCVFLFYILATFKPTCGESTPLAGKGGRKFCCHCQHSGYKYFQNPCHFFASKCLNLKILKFFKKNASRMKNYKKCLKMSKITDKMSKFLLFLDIQNILII
jgi:hypothetical protein